MFRGSVETHTFYIDATVIIPERCVVSACCYINCGWQFGLKYCNVRRLRLVIFPSFFLRRGYVDRHLLRFDQSTAKGHIRAKQNVLLPQVK